MTENEITEAIIGAAIEVHRALGPGLIEQPYEEALCHELHLRGLAFERQLAVSVNYKGVRLSANLRLDLIVEQRVIIDLKAKEQVTGIDKAKLRTYLHLSDRRLGLIINSTSSASSMESPASSTSSPNPIPASRPPTSMPNPLRPSASSAPLR